MNTVVSLLLMFINSLDKNMNYHISKYFLINMNRIEHLKISVITEECNVSFSTLNKFFKTLGYKTWKDMKTDFEKSKRVRLGQIKARYQLLDEGQLLKQLYQLFPGKVNQESLIKKIQTVALLINQNDEIYIVSSASTLSLLSSFQEDLWMMGKRVYFDQISLGHPNSHCNKDALYIFLSITGRYYIHHRDDFITLYNQGEKRVFITQNQDILRYCHYDEAIQLFSEIDTELENVSIWYIFTLIKLVYYKKYFKDITVKK